MIIQSEMKQEIAIFDESLIPKNNKNIGNIAVAGNERKKWSIISFDRYAFCENPNHKPIGIPNIVASMNHKNAFHNVCQIFMYPIYDVSNRYTFGSISCKEGNKTVLNRCIVYMHCHRIIITIGLIIM